MMWNIVSAFVGYQRYSVGWGSFSQPPFLPLNGNVLQVNFRKQFYRLPLHSNHRQKDLRMP